MLTIPGLLHNDKGKLSADSASRLNLGMVTDAIWTDYDNDGWEDLLVAREWNSLVILKNMNGKELVPQNIPELEDNMGSGTHLLPGILTRMAMMTILQEILVIITGSP